MIFEPLITDFYFRPLLKRECDKEKHFRVVRLGLG
jgi:hypothetical protein